MHRGKTVPFGCQVSLAIKPFVGDTARCTDNCHLSGFCWPIIAVFVLTLLARMVSVLLWLQGKSNVLLLGTSRVVSAVSDTSRVISAVGSALVLPLTAAFGYPTLRESLRQSDTS